MLLDWPDRKKDLEGLIREALRRRADARAPLAALASHFTICEGKRIDLVGSDGTRSQMQLQAHQARIELSKEEILANVGGAAPDALGRLADRLGDQIDRSMIKELRHAPARVGTMFGGSTAKDIGRQILDGLRAMEIEFDEDGTARLAFVVHPDAASRLAAVNADPNLRRQFDAVLEGKHDDWVLRESRRRLAD